MGKKIKSLDFLKYFKDLFYFNRSLTGEGTLKTLKYFKNINSSFKIIKFKSNTKVFDWTVPMVWKIKEAYIQDLKTKKKFADFKKNNLHIVGYSTPIKKIININSLKKKIYTDKYIKSAIPYITSYYKKDWGFCMSQNDLKKMRKGKYLAYINSKFIKGYMNGGELIIKGTSKKEIFFTSYICHPSMANNELSGPILLNAIIKWIKTHYKKTRYTYRFVLLPETIGSIAYLSKNYKNLKKNTIAAFNVSCVGAGKEYSLIESRNGDSIADSAIKCQIIKQKKYKIYSYLDRGSDERQYCYPGIDLPMATFCRSKFGTYKEYHTSHDNLKIIKNEIMEGSLKIFQNVINTFELGPYPENVIKCEPMLSKRNLYPSISKRENYLNSRNRMNFLAYCDGRNIFEISLKTKINLEKILDEYKILLKHKVLRSKFEK